MKIYKKRVAFVISKQHFIPHGGIGIFAKTFYEMCEELNWCLDIILDLEPSDNPLTSMFREEKVNMYHPEKPLSYATHNAVFTNGGDGINYERVINFRNSFMNALKRHTYDLIITNSPESALGVYNLSLQSIIPLVFYTHNENIVFFDSSKLNVFNESFEETSKQIMSFKDIIVGTQTKRNKDIIKQNYPNCEVFDLPMRVPERALLEQSNIEGKEGILFIGRYEKRKNPEAFIRVIKETGIKALVLTGGKSVDKWKRAFSDNQITNYEIMYDTIGDDKVKFIKKARLGFHPSLLESYGFCALETLHTCPTFALKENHWWINFDGLIKTTHKHKMTSDIKEAYNSVTQEDLEWLNKKMISWDRIIANKWKEFLERKLKKLSTGTDSSLFVKTVKEQGYINLYDFYNDTLKRKDLCMEDVFPTLKNRGKFIEVQTKEKTFVVKDDTVALDFLEDKTESFGNFFG